MYNFRKRQDIYIDKLRAGDNLIINTENHRYNFKMVDPVHRCGVLSGGLLNEGECEAALLGAVGSDLEKYNNGSIRTRTKAVFLLKLHNKTICLHTSLITNLKLLRSTESWKSWFKTIAEKTGLQLKRRLPI